MSNINLTKLNRSYDVVFLYSFFPPLSLNTSSITATFWFQYIVEILYCKLVIVLGNIKWCRGHLLVPRSSDDNLSLVYQAGERVENNNELSVFVEIDGLRVGLIFW